MKALKFVVVHDKVKKRVSCASCGGPCNSMREIAAKCCADCMHDDPDPSECSCEWCSEDRNDMDYDF